MISKLKKLTYLFLILTLVGCSSARNSTNAGTNNPPTHTLVISPTQTMTSTTIFDWSTSKPFVTSTPTPTLAAKPSATPTIEPSNPPIPICAGKGQIISPPSNIGITGTIVYQVDEFNGLYTIGGTSLSKGKIVDQQQKIVVFGFSPDGNWLAYASELDNAASDKIVFSTPVMNLLSAGGERLEQKINIDGLEEELQNRCVGCQGFHFFDSIGEWINNNLMQLYLGARANIEGSAYAALPKVFDPLTGNWQDQWFRDLPDLYTITPMRATFHHIQLSPDLSRVVYPAKHGGVILQDVTQDIKIWLDSQFQNDFGENIEWSPDSRMVAVVNLFYPEKHRLLLITRNGEVTELVNANIPQLDFHAGSLSWSRDSRYLAFVASIGSLDQDGELYLYLYDTQTRNYLYHCPLPGVNDISDASLIWSPDGQWIAYREQPMGAMRLLNVQSGEIIEILENAKPVGWSDKFPVELP